MESINFEELRSHNLSESKVGDKFLCVFHKGKWYSHDQLESNVVTFKEVKLYEYMKKGKKVSVVERMTLEINGRDHHMYSDTQLVVTAGDKRRGDYARNDYVTAFIPLEQLTQEALFESTLCGDYKEMSKQLRSEFIKWKKTAN